MRLLGLLILLGCMACSLSACNTVRGAGADVASTGFAVERAASPAPYYYYY